MSYAALPYNLVRPSPWVGLYATRVTSLFAAPECLSRSSLCHTTHCSSPRLTLPPRPDSQRTSASFFSSFFLMDEFQAIKVVVFEVYVT